MAILDPGDGNNISFTENTFEGGMNLFGELSNIQDTQYGPAFNLRNRTKSLVAVKDALVDTNAPTGLFQGIVGLEDFVLVFVSGQAFIRAKEATQWFQITNFLMSTTAERFYTCAVPTSTFNFIRKLDPTAPSLTGNALKKTLLVTMPEGAINPSRAGLIVQDGETQPWIILSDGTADKLQTYAQWNLADNADDGYREYVPIGTQMTYTSGILFCMSPDGLFLFRSVTGRPTDFVVNIALDGTAGGDASTTAYAVDFNPATCLKVLNTGQLFIGTALISHIVDIDTTDTIFDEPTFNDTGTIAAGVINQESFIDILGDYAFIDSNGLRSFNAVQSQNAEGRNSVFSANINTILQNIEQTDLISSAIGYNNWAIFSVQTQYGYALVVYDMILSVWVSIDVAFGSPIKQFAVVSEFDTLKLFGITDNSVVDLYSSDSSTYATASVQTADYTSGDARIELQLSEARAVFNHDVIADSVISKRYINGVSDRLVTTPIVSESTGITYPAQYPVEFGTSTRTSNIVFNYNLDSKTGWRIGCVFQWKNAARLVTLQLDAFKITGNISQQQKTAA